MKTLSASNAMLAAVFFLLAIGCGSGSGSSGSDENDGGAGTSNPTGTGGTAATGAGGSNDETGGTAGSSSGSGGSTGAGGREGPLICPPTAPMVGSSCSLAVSICTYGGGTCCGGGYRCSGGKWEVIEAACACTQPPDGGGQPDAMSVPDAASSGGCSAAITLADCDARPACHPVFLNQMVCGCAAPGCCIHYQRCAEGKKAKCTAAVGLGCAIQQPVCEGPYVVGYTNICYEGCVRATDCGA